MDTEPSGSRQDIINKFKEICAVDNEIAEAALSSNNWNLEAAVRVFLDGEDNNPPEQQFENNDSDYEENLIPQNVTPSNQITRNNQQNTGFLGWLAERAWFPITLAIASLRFLFDFIVSLFGGAPLYVADPRQEVAQFVNKFRENYDQNRRLPWLEMSYQSAVEESKRRINYLLIYIHNPSHRRANDFAQNYLLSTEFSNFIQQNDCLIWGTSSRSSEGYKVCSALRDFNFPFVALICIVENRPTSIFRMSGEFTLASMIDGLRNAAISARPMLDRIRQLREMGQLISSWIWRFLYPPVYSEQIEVNRQLQREQDADYQRSLAADRERQRAAADLERQKQQELDNQREQERELENKKKHQAELALTIPSEPLESDSDIITIRLRFPTGEQKLRRFRMSEQVNWLSSYVESVGFDMDTHCLWTSEIPRKLVSNEDLTKTFAEIGWPRREQIIVDEK